SPGWRATLRPPVSSSTATPPAVPAAVAAASTGRGCPPRRHGHGCLPADSRPARWPKPCAACAPGAWTWRAASSPRPASRIPIACTDSSWRYGVPTPAMPIDFSRYPDEHGHFGRFGGSFVAETLVAPLAELRDAYLRYRVDPEFVAELERDYRHYIGRPSPVYHAERLSRQVGGARILLKREDLNHTGAHKINNTVGQALLAKRMGKCRIIAETGAGQHGVASATVAARLGLECVVYMRAGDVDRQAVDAFRRKLLGATVVPVHSGSKTLKDALNEAIRDWVTNVSGTFYIIGTVAGPH